MHRRFKEFNVGEYVMICIHPERIPKTFSKKLYARAKGPYSIIRKLGSNAYLLDLPNDMDISPVFNVEYLLPYRGTIESSTLPSSVSPGELSKGASTVPSLQYSKEVVDIILDDEFVTSRDYGFHHFFVKWHGRLNSDATWLQEDDLRHLDHLLLDCYLFSHFSESSSFQLGGNYGAWSRPISSLDEIGNPHPMIIFIIISYLFNRTFWPKPKPKFISVRVFYWCLKIILYVIVFRYT